MNTVFQLVCDFNADLCRKMHEDDPDATSEDCDAELSIIRYDLLCVTYYYLLFHYSVNL